MKRELTVLARCTKGAFAAFAILANVGHADTHYRLPPPEVIESDDQAGSSPPLATASPDGALILLQYRYGRPSVDSLAKLTVLAGWRVYRAIDRAASARIQRFSLVDAMSGEPRGIELPAGDLGQAVWSPDSRHFAFVRSVSDHTELWIVDVAQATAKAVPGVRLNAAHSGGLPCSWAAKGEKLWCLLVPEGRATLSPSRPDIEPRVDDTADRPGKTAALMIRDSRLHDKGEEALYEYHMTAQPAAIDATDMTVRRVGSPAIYDKFEPSPDGRFILSVRIVPPYSYQTTDASFPRVVEVLDTDGHLVHTVTSLPLDISGGDPTSWQTPGPRNFFWRPDEPAALAWYQALDGGDIRTKATYRDSLMSLAAPFTQPARELFRSQGRMGSDPVHVVWGRNGLAVVEEYDWLAHLRRVWKLDTRGRAASPELLWEYSVDKVNASPGAFLTKLGPISGREEAEVRTVQNATLLQADDGSFYLRGVHTSETGDYPFLRRFDMRTRKTREIFTSKVGEYAQVISILDPNAQRLLVAFETPRIPQNIRLLNTRTGLVTALSNLQASKLDGALAAPQLITYKRADGVDLSGQLYLPTSYKLKSRIPVVFSFYPGLQPHRDGARRWDHPPNRFQGIAMTTHMWPLLTQGIAVFDGGTSAMPLTPPSGSDSTMVAEMVANAEAAVHQLLALDIAAPGRIGVAGGSDGAFVAAHLLANTDLFAAGVGVSGFYNPELMPFGTRGTEPRSYWQVPHVYDQISAFRHADRIKAPLLLIHGERDESAGASVIQSIRFYEALYGLGATARLVVMPFEGHGLQARESALDEYAEIIDWFNKYLKNSRD